MANASRPDLGINPVQGRPSVDSLMQGAGERLRDVARSRPFVAFVAVTAVFVGLYFFVLAAPIYVSQASFSIRGRDAPMVEGSLLSSLAGGAGSTSTGVEAGELNQYILSQDMLAKLDQRFHLREVWSRPRPDFLNWLSPRAKKEDFLTFYRKMIDVRIDHDTNIVTVEARAFDAKTAQEIAEAVLEISAVYVDGLSTTVRNDTLKASQQELAQAEDAVRNARLAMTRYRITTGLLDPTASAAAAGASIASMQQEVAESRAEMTSLLSFNQPRAAPITQLQAKIAGLEAQIAKTQQRSAADTKGNESLAERLYEYEGLAVTNDYADKQLVAALGAYDAARAVAGQRERFIVRITNPIVPDRATRPHRLFSFLETMMVLVALYGVGALAIAGVRDHQGI